MFTTNIAAGTYVELELHKPEDDGNAVDRDFLLAARISRASTAWSCRTRALVGPSPQPELRGRDQHLNRVAGPLESRAAAFFPVDYREHAEHSPALALDRTDRCQR